MYTYLALGDSYTIGEQVSSGDNFPHQTVALLAGRELEVAAPLIIATTGWTTDELATAIRGHRLQETFSFVTLLIGVNNQYRGRDVANYREEFTALLNQAILFANGHPRHVFVLSIPDWGVTPFAAGKDREQIGREIDAYNAANRDITLAHKCNYTDITDSTRIHGTDPAFLADDGLHPSGKEYGIWAARLAPVIANVLQR